MSTGGENTVEAMIRTLEHDRDASARLRAAEALGKLRSKAAKAALERAMRDPDPRVAAAAQAAVRMIA
jgi:HEAT repeat protein